MIVLGFGSNLGDREGNIVSALKLLAAHSQITIKQVSALYETDAVGVITQPDYLNAVIAIETSLSPEQLLEVCLGVEQSLGRVRLERWGPRTIDIDLVLYNDCHMVTEQLTVPHPLFYQRGFVLVPLAEIAGNVPVYEGLTPDELLARCSSVGVRKYKLLNWKAI